VGGVRHLLADSARDRPATVIYVSKPGTAAEMNVAQIELAMETGIASMLVPPHGLYPFLSSRRRRRCTRPGGGGVGGRARGRRNQYSRIRLGSI